MPKNTPTYLVVALVFVLCIAVLFVFYIPAAIGVYSDEFERVAFDFHSYFLPKFAFGSEEILRGYLPLWNRFEFAGLPFMATAQPAALYPPKVILFALFKPEVAYRIFMVLHYIAMAVFFLLFARNLHISAVSAAVGGAVWTFCNLVLSSNYHPNRIANLIWVPLFFLFVERVVQGKNRRDFIGLTAVIAIQFTAGYPETCLDLAVLVSIYAVLSWMVGKWKIPPWKTVSLFAVAFILASFIAAFQLLPLAELLLASKRADFIVSSSIPVQSVLNNAKNVILFSFPALMSFVLIGLGQSRAIQPSICLVLCTFMFSGGWLLLQKLPGYKDIRFPYVWMFLSTFFLAWLAALGADTFLLKGSNNPRPSKHLDRDGDQDSKQQVLPGKGPMDRILHISRSLGRYRFIPFNNRWIVGIISAIFAGYCIRQLIFPFIHKYEWMRSLLDSGYQLFSFQNELNAGFGLLGAIILLIVVFFPLSGELRHWGVLLSILLLILGHTASFSHLAHSAPMKQPQPKSRLVQILGNPDKVQGRTLSLFDLRHGYAMTERIESLFGAEMSTLPWRYRVILYCLRVHSFSAAYYYRNWYQLTSTAGFLDVMNLQYLVAPSSKRRLLSLYGFKKVGESKFSDALFLNKGRMGKAWINYGVEVASSPIDAMSLLLSSYFNPRKKVILEQIPLQSYSDSNILLATPVSHQTRLSPVEVEYHVTLKRPGVFVVSESGYPGWQAIVDGKPTKWLQANFLLRAVELSPGTHTLRFVYRPWWINVAKVLTGLGFVVLLIILFWRSLVSLAQKQLGRI